jgi:hypothetical protein
MSGSVRMSAILAGAVVLALAGCGDATTLKPAHTRPTPAARCSNAWTAAVRYARAHGAHGDRVTMIAFAKFERDHKLAAMCVGIGG